LNKSVIAAKYDPVAGWLDSNALIYRYVQATERAQIALSVAETEICVVGGCVTGVNTSVGKIDAPNVSVAAGAGSRAVGRSAGVELPIVLRPRQSFTTGWRHAEFPEDAPMLIGSAPHPHVRPEAQDGAIFGWEYTWHSKHAGPEYGTNAAKDAIIDPVTPVAQLKDPRFPSITLALLARQFGDAPGQGFGDSRYLRGLSHNIFGARQARKLARARSRERSGPHARATDGLLRPQSAARATGSAARARTDRLHAADAGAARADQGPS
jgi:hypothetical protein